MSKKFIKIPKEFWENDEIKKQSSSVLRFLIDLLFISYTFNHKPFYQTTTQLYEKCKLKNRMSLSRKKEKLKQIKIKIYKIGKNYHFDLSEFFKKYYNL
jgi:hypothetical protein